MPTQVGIHGFAARSDVAFLVMPTQVGIHGFAARSWESHGCRPPPT
jgi:hypothetical protein